jgi:hypothetical protein
MRGQIGNCIIGKIQIIPQKLIKFIRESKMKLFILSGLSSLRNSMGTSNTITHLKIASGQTHLTLEFL